jgi:carbon-monoxide dehydrogenase large subunit
MLVALMFTGPYRIPKLGFSCRTVFTNTCGKAPFRGPWAVETIAREQLVDAVAAELGLDPLELRRRNVIHQSDLPYTLWNGMVYDIVTPEETLEQAASLFDWAAFRAQQAAARAEGRYVGAGLSLFVEPSAVGFGAWASEAAVVRIDVSGQVEVLMGSGSHGHSLETTIPQVVADHLGCRLEDVVLRQGGDTPYGPGTGGSRSAVILGGAAQTAATMVREKVVAVAAQLLEAAPEDLEVADSTVSVRGTPAKAVSFAEVAATAYLNPAALPPGSEAGLEATHRFQPPSPFTWSNACHICVCEIDPETGVVRLEDYVVSEDCGVMINPNVVEGQIAGGVVQSIGGALYEEMAYDADGNPLATTFMDYLVPTAADVPDLTFGHLETPSASLGGYKGLGEGGAIASPAAVANAVNDALRPLGITITQFPISPARIREAIQAARNGFAAPSLPGGSA